jgi:hypothetical protein
VFVSGCSVVDQKSIMWRGVASVEGCILHHIILSSIFSVGVCLKYTEIKQNCVFAVQLNVTSELAKYA